MFVDLKSVEVAKERRIDSWIVHRKEFKELVEVFKRNIVWLTENPIKFSNELVKKKNEKIPNKLPKDFFKKLATELRKN